MPHVVHSFRLPILLLHIAKQHKDDAMESPEAGALKSNPFLTRRFFRALFFGLIFAACSTAPTPETGGSEATVFPAPTGSTPLEHILTIGEDGGGPLIGSAGAPTFGRSGQIYVRDYPASQVHEYKSDGEFVRVIGNPGNGPGEFRSLDNVQVWGDSLYVMDRMNSRVSVFEQTTGSFVRSQSVDIEDWRASELMGVARSGLFIVYTTVPGMEAYESSDNEIRLVPFAAANPSTAPVIWHIPKYETIPIDINGMTFQRAKPLGNRSECDFQGERGYCGYSASLSVDVFSLSGDTLQTLTVPTEPRLVTDQEREAEMAVFTNDAVREQVVVSETHPEFSGPIIADDDGRGWFRRRVSDNATEYWILDPANTTTLSATIPGRAIIHDVKGGRAVALIVDSDGLRSVHVFAAPDPADS